MTICGTIWQRANFNPRPPCGGRPQAPGKAWVDMFISIHVLRVEDDVDDFGHVLSFFGFQSTSSVWRTTRNLSAGSCGYNISIHVLHVEDDALSMPAMVQRTIFQSTSSVWRTTLFRAGRCAGNGISIHVLRVEDDDFANIERKIDNVFQSTSSVWRTTSAVGFQALPPVYFNPRPPCGGRHAWPVPELLSPHISIHVLRVEDDSMPSVTSP